MQPMLLRTHRRIYTRSGPRQSDRRVCAKQRGNPRDRCQYISSASYNDEMGEPNLPELLKIDTSIPICIKHPYHHLYRMKIETRKITVNQRLPQLPLCQPACASSIDCFEKREERGIGAATNGGWCRRWSRWRRRTPLKSLWWRTKAVILGRGG